MSLQEGSLPFGELRVGIEENPNLSYQRLSAKISGEVFPEDIS